MERGANDLLHLLHRGRVLATDQRARTNLRPTCCNDTTDTHHGRRSPHLEVFTPAEEFTRAVSYARAAAISFLTILCAAFARKSLSPKKAIRVFDENKDDAARRLQFKPRRLK
jgi:hypothetical protein